MKNLLKYIPILAGVIGIGLYAYTNWEPVPVVTPEPPVVEEVIPVEPGVVEPIAPPPHAPETMQQAMIDLYNQYRLANGMDRVASDAKLMQVAKDRAMALATSGLPSTAPAPSWLLQRLRDAQYPLAPNDSRPSAYEFIAVGHANFEVAFLSWTRGNGQSENLKDPLMKDIGVYLHEDPESQHKSYFVMVLGRKG